MKAERRHWKIKLSDISQPKRIDFSIKFTDEQFEKITNGLIPEEMEDKWFIFFEDDWLYFHRSWTGNCQFKLRITKEEDEKQYSVKDFYAERNPERYKCVDDFEDISKIQILINRGLLGIEEKIIDLAKEKKSSFDLIQKWSDFGNLFIDDKMNSEKKDQFRLIQK